MTSSSYYTTTPRATTGLSSPTRPVELRKLLAAACVTEGITPVCGQWLEAIVHSMEAINDGHRFRLAYLRKHSDTQMHHGDSFALELDRVYDANIASAAKTTARQRFGGALRRNDRDRDGGGGSRENFKTTRPVREAVAPRAPFAKDAIMVSSKGKAKVEAPSVDKAECWGAPPCLPRQPRFEDTPPGLRARLPSSVALRSSA
eukprot:jgi/Tetstr1/454939/TSEL_041800.t1